MKIEILTLFPELFDGFISSSLIEKAIEKKFLEITRTNIRTYASPPHMQVDDTPFGGGAGMVMKPEPLTKAILDAKRRHPHAKVVFPSPAGKKLDQHSVVELSKVTELIFLCGRYEGVDQRVIDSLVDMEVSLGDYILMGGELPTMVIIEATARYIPGVLGNSASLVNESFSGNGHLLECPQFTKPQEFEGMKVPDVLLSGDHKKILEWRTKESIERTKTRRPDLIEAATKYIGK